MFKPRQAKITKQAEDQPMLSFEEQKLLEKEQIESERELLLEQAAAGPTMLGRPLAPWRRVWQRWVGSRRAAIGP